MANLGLALQNSKLPSSEKESWQFSNLTSDYAALMVLRCLQSAGSSGATALVNGVVSDIITPQERGSFIAFSSIGSILGLALSPLIGGLITQYLDWHCIFWFMFILNGAFCVPFFLFFPETCRNVVGDGSVFSPPLNRCLTDYLRRRKQTQEGIEAAVAPVTGKEKAVIFDPTPTLKVFASKEIALILIPSGITFGTLYAVVTGASSAFKSIYLFDPLHVSFMYIPIGIGTIASAFTIGKLVDWNFHRHAAKLGVTITRNKHEDLSNFPLEKARLQVGLPLFYLGTACIVIYGWVLQHRYSIWGPVVLLVIMSWTQLAFYQVTNVLVVDTYPGRGASVSAAVNIVRCEIGAAAAALINPMTEGTGYGWAYTILAIVGLAASPLLLLTARKGMQWRKEAKEKERTKTLGK